jgi:hypothetical protein
MSQTFDMGTFLSSAGISAHVEYEVAPEEATSDRAKDSSDRATK